MLCANFNHQTLKVSMSILAQIIGTFVYLFDAQIQPQIQPQISPKSAFKSAQAQSMILQVHTAITFDLFWAIH